MNREIHEQKLTPIGTMLPVIKKTLYEKSIFIKMVCKINKKRKRKVYVILKTITCSIQNLNRFYMQSLLWSVENNKISI